MANVIIIRPISESWSGEIYKADDIGCKLSDIANNNLIKLENRKKNGTLHGSGDQTLSIPHGPLTLSAHLIDKGFDPLIIDEIALTQTIESEISEKAIKILKDALKKERPICVGISSMTGEQIRRGKTFAKMIRDFDETVPIVWGGAHPSLLPEMTIEDETVDLICTGEGDISFPILVKELQKNGSCDLSKVPGLVYKEKNNEIKKTKQPPLYRMDDMPPFPYRLLDMELYIKNIKKKYITRYFEINSSRGCPYKCAFCLNSKEGIPYTKARSSRIIQEMVRLKKEYNIDGISFNDENFILNKKRIEEIAQAAIDLDLNIKMRGGGRVELFLKFDDRYLELFKRAGFYHFALGVESGSNKTLKSINKQITTDQIFEVIDALVKHKFQATYNFIGGFPNETIEDFKETLRTIYHIFEKCKYMVYPVLGPWCYCPLPGTKNFDDAVALGHKVPKSFEEWADLDYNIKKMVWISEEFHKFLVESREIIKNINIKYTGDNAVITKDDLKPLAEIMN